MTRLKTLALVAVILAAAATPSAAYYHYVHYLNSSSPYQVIFEKYDLAALPDKTVTFFVSDAGPTSYTANDSFPSLLAQFRNATQVWNSVASSDLRVAFGGLQVPGTPQSVPTGEVFFDPEMPPGVLAFAGHQVPTSIPAGAQFVPIQESFIHLNNSLTRQPGQASGEGYAGPSYSELFFTVLVHEIGHAIGLQHTYTSATMSTAVSRSTNRARPLDADDIAGVSLLYPRGGFPVGYGSISGTVTMNGRGVHMASVVALLPNGSAVSNLTSPDGTYEIDGLPPGSYFVYVHPLPPALDADIASPLDPNGNAVPPSGPFVTTFYNGTWNPNQFTPVPVAQGSSVTNIDFSVQPRSVVEVYDVTSYSWTGSSYVQPAFLTASAAVPDWNNGVQPTSQVVAQGNGITIGTNSTNLLSVVALGAPGGWVAGAAPILYQDVDVTLLAMYFDYPSAPAIGPEHLLFQLSDDIFVLPWGLQIVQNPPPVVTSVTPNADGSVTVAGTGLSSSSQVFFDSLPGQFTLVQPPAPACPSSGACSTLVSVTPPPGASGQTATITVYNPDGQNSTFLQSPAQSPFTYSYPQSSPPAAAISLSQLPQGMSAMVTVTATSGMQFVDGLTTLGFGSGDVAVRRLWWINPTTAIANVTVSPFALLRETVATVISGFQVYEQPLGFQVVAANPNLPVIGLPVTSAFYPAQNSLYPGAIAAIYGQNLQAAGENPAITVGGLSATTQYVSPTQINFTIPAGVPLGPAVMTLQGGLPVVLQIDAPPPSIAGAATAAGVALVAGQTAAPGDTITLIVTGMDPAVVSAPNRVGITEAGVSIPAFTIQLAQDGSGNLLIQFALAASITGQQVPVTVSRDGDLSEPILMDVAAQ